MSTEHPLRIDTASAVESVLAELRAPGQRGRSKTMFVGEVVLDRMFAGSPCRWLARGRQDEVFDALCRDPRLPVAPTYLCNAVDVVAVARGLPADLAVALGVSQLRALSRIGEPKLRLELARQAVGNGWSGRELNVAIRSAQIGRNVSSSVQGLVRAARRVRCLLERGAIVSHDDQAELLAECTRLTPFLK